MRNAVMFDLDGTLINSLDDIAGSMNRVLERRGLPVHPVEAYRLFTGDGAMNLTRRALGGRLDLAEAVYREYRAEYEAHSREKTAPYAGVPQMLFALKAGGIRLMVLSNKDHHDVQAVVAHYFPDVDFDAVQGRMDGYPVKPDPALGLRVLEKLGIAAERMWYVGDTCTDMRCAHNLGAAAVAVTWGFQTREQLRQGAPLCFADTPHALTEMILSGR